MTKKLEILGISGEGNRNYCRDYVVLSSDANNFLFLLKAKLANVLFSFPVPLAR